MFYHCAKTSSSFNFQPFWTVNAIYNTKTITRSTKGSVNYLSKIKQHHIKWFHLLAIECTFCSAMEKLPLSSPYFPFQNLFLPPSRRKVLSTVNRTIATQQGRYLGQHLAEVPCPLLLLSKDNRGSSAREKGFKGTRLFSRWIYEGCSVARGIQRSEGT